MKLLDEIESFFGTRNLYEVIDVNKEATDQQIKKAYRKASLKIHPDRVPELEKEKATKKFQVLSQVHFILNDEERRKLYDDHGLIANEENLESQADWENYWRFLFPKISDDDIDKFYEKYIGSEEEEQDLIKLYNRFEGDLNLLFETHISYDENRTTEMLNRLLKEEKIPAYPKFLQDTKAKKFKREKRIAKEAREANKIKQEMKNKSGVDVDNIDDLSALIKRKSQNNFDSMIANLEAKYANGNKGVKRKKGHK